MKIEIHESAKIEKLISAIINGAIQDFLLGDPIKQVEAVEFLASKDFQLYASIVPITLEELEPERARKVLQQKYKVKDGRYFQSAKQTKGA